MLSNMNRRKFLKLTGTVVLATSVAGALGGCSGGGSSAPTPPSPEEEGIAFETMDIVNAMQKDSGIRLKELKVDGGASRNNLMMQFQADILGCKVIRPRVTETTAMGACYLAGLATGYWDSLDDIRKQWKADKEFEPLAPAEKVLLAKEGWADAIRRTLSGKGQ